MLFENSAPWIKLIWVETFKLLLQQQNLVLSSSLLYNRVECLLCVLRFVQTTTTAAAAMDVNTKQEKRSNNNDISSTSANAAALTTTLYTLQKVVEKTSDLVGRTSVRVVQYPSFRSLFARPHADRSIHRRSNQA